MRQINHAVVVTDLSQGGKGCVAYIQSQHFIGQRPLNEIIP